MISLAKNNVLVFNFCALFYLLLCLSISIQSQSYGEVALIEAGLFVCFAIAIWLMALLLGKINGLPSKTWIISWSIIFQLCLLPAYPILENDVLRYLWDGYVFVETGNPYGIRPAEFFYDESIPLLMQGVLDLISYPSSPTVYGPVAEVVFAIAYILSPANEFTIKFVMFLSVVGIVLLISPRVSREKLLLFSWCPLVLFQFSLNAHIDSLAVVLMLSALIYSQHRIWWVASVLLSLAIMTKIFAILAVPFILVLKRQYFVTAVLLSLVYIPLLFSGKHEFLGLSVMAEFWMFNSLFYSAWVYLFDNLWIKIVSLMFFLVCYVSVYIKYKDDFNFEHRCIALFIIYAVFLFSLSALNAWYLLWLLCFALFTPYRWPWVFACTVWLYMMTGLNLNDESMGLYEIPMGILIAEYVGIILISLALSWYFSTREQGKAIPLFSKLNIDNQ